jgi:glycosyltransferase involved in cell wall biosynthesis
MRIGIDCRKIADYGIGTYIRGLLGGFAAAEQDETFVLFGPRSIDPHLPAGLRAERAIVDAPHYSIRELAAVAVAARRARVDVFHAPHYVVPFVAAPVVVTIHDLIHLRLAYRNPLRPLYARGMIRRAVRSSAAILTVTESVRAEIEREFPAARGKIEAIPNGVLPLFSPEPRATDEAVLGDRGLDRRAFFLYVGNDKPHKRLDLLLAAWRTVQPQMPHLRLALAGGAPVTYASAPGVVVAGHVSGEELASLYRNALALVQPSDFEGFGLPVAEAMASGTPVICSDIPALREVAGGAGRFFERGDAASLANAMAALCASDPMPLAEAGLRRARELTWERAAERTLAVYRRAAVARA